MTYNIDFIISGLIFLLLILYHFFFRRNPDRANSRIIMVVLVIGIADIFFDLLCTIFMAYPAPWRAGLTELCLMILYLLQITMLYVLYLYLHGLHKRMSSVDRIASWFWLIPSIMMGILIISNHWHGLLFRVTSDGIYASGPLYQSMYIYALIVAALIALESLLNYHNIERRNFLVIWEFLLVVVGCVLVQSLSHDMLTTSFGIALGISIMFLTINNPYDSTDSLTMAYDTESFRETAQYYIDHNKSFHIVTVDLFRLKQINSVLGVGIGNQLLIQTAKFLRETCQATQLFRITGNRFAIITCSLSSCQFICTQLRDKKSDFITLNNEQINSPCISCCIIGAERLKSCDELLSYVEYLVSLAPRSTESQMIQSSNDTLIGFQYTQEVENYLPTAIEQDLFDVVYQPVYSAKTGACVTLEALSRLTHPTLGPVSPEHFIAAAERNGQISRISALQFHRVCRFIKEHESLMSVIQSVKFNLSPAELLRSNCGQDFINIIHSYNLQPRYFQFEITETVATEYIDTVFQTAKQFEAVGIQLCLDDFGSGYANLNTVLKLPFRAIKMDRSLLNGICEDEKIAHFYHSILSTLQGMGFIVITEGVETKEEMQLVRQWGVDLVQGYFLSKPISGDALLKLLAKKA